MGIFKDLGFKKNSNGQIVSPNSERINGKTLGEIQTEIVNRISTDLLISPDIDGNIQLNNLARTPVNVLNTTDLLLNSNTDDCYQFNGTTDLLNGKTVSGGLDTNTSLLLSGSLTDKTGKIGTIYGNTSLSNVRFKNNPSSIYFDGTVDYISYPASSDFNFTNGSFTIECWVYPIAHITSYPCIFSNYNGFTTGALSLFAGHNSSSGSKYQVAISGVFPAIRSTSSIIYNAWTHLAIIRNNNVISLYINGILEGTYNYSGNISYIGSNISIGTSLDSIAASCFNGYIDDLRISKGIARYTSNFTPPIFKAINQDITYNTLGKYGSSAIFNGTSSVLGTDKVTTSFPFSFSGWIKKDLSTVSSSDEIIYSIKLGGSTLSIGINNITSGNLFVAYNGNNYYKGTTSIDNDFFHLCVVATGVNTYSVYINNELITLTDSGIVYSGSTDDNCLGSNSGTSNFLNAELDQVRLFRTVLSVDEVKVVYDEIRYDDNPITISQESDQSNWYKIKATEVNPTGELYINGNLQVVESVDGNSTIYKEMAVNTRELTILQKQSSDQLSIDTWIGVPV